MSELPPRIRAEVKFTTGTGIGVPIRELEALPAGPRCAAVVAGLFLCGDAEIDGRWLIADARGTFGRRAGDSVSVGKDELSRAHLSQPAHDAIRDHLDANWRSFLAANLELAVKGHDATKSGLDRLHKEGRLTEGFPEDRILDAEHAEHMKRVVESLGESQSGVIFQDLFAYSLALGGYKDVGINAVGVPDVELAGLSGSDSGFSAGEVAEIAAACRQSGRMELAVKVERELGG